MHGAAGHGVTGRAQNTETTLRRVLPTQIVLHPDQVAPTRLYRASTARTARLPPVPRTHARTHVYGRRAVVHTHTHARTRTHARTHSHTRTPHTHAQVEKDRLEKLENAVVLLGGDEAERAARAKLYEMRLDPQHWCVSTESVSQSVSGWVGKSATLNEMRLDPQHWCVSTESVSQSVSGWVSTQR
jgi:hypothetical protein